MRIVAAGSRAACWAMTALGVLLVVSAWTIPYAVELVGALLLLYAGLVVAGAAPGHRPASAALLLVALVAVLMLPPDIAWGGIDRALHVALGICLAAFGLRKALAPSRELAVPA